MVNMKEPNLAINRISSLLQTLSPPCRLEILLTIGMGEACVCHLEAALRLRQAYISQHLMAMRDSGIIIARREGRYIFYRLADPGLIDLIHQAGKMAGLSESELEALPEGRRIAHCCCPHCAQEVIRE